MQIGPTKTAADFRLDGRVLVIDDNQDLCGAIGLALQVAGCEVQTATDPFDGLARLESFAPDVLISDVRMPGVDGFSVLAAARGLDPFLGIVLITGYGEVSDAVRAMRHGAEDYVTKPVAMPELLEVLGRLRARQRARAHLRLHRATTTAAPHGLELIGGDHATLALQREVANAAQLDTPVLLIGERGTDREGVARAIHALSSRADKSFVRVDCGGLTGALFDVEVFGREAPPRDGRIKRAEGGTLFLDDAGQIPPATQARIHRLITANRYERGGAREPIAANVRVIVASELATGPFVESLATSDPARANALTRVAIPPLRARKSDIPVLVDYALAAAAGELGRSPPAVEPDAVELLRRYEWPGNLRELHSVLSNLVSLAPNVPISAAAVRPSLRRRAAPVSQDLAIPGATFEAIERHAILATYEGCGRNVLLTARILGISPRAVHYRLREYRGETGRRSPARVSGGKPPGEAR